MGCSSCSPRPLSSLNFRNGDDLESLKSHLCIELFLLYKPWVHYKCNPIQSDGSFCNVGCKDKFSTSVWGGFEDLLLLLITHRSVDREDNKRSNFFSFWNERLESIRADSRSLFALFIACQKAKNVAFFFMQMDSNCCIDTVKDSFVFLACLILNLYRVTSSTHVNNRAIEQKCWD